VSDEPETPEPVEPAEGTAGEPAEEPDRQDDGLDLARALTRATASGGLPAKRRARRTPPAPGRGRVSGAHPDDRDPQLIGPTLERLVGDRGWELDLRVQGVFGRWPELVGAEVAQHCTPETFADGKLVVRTDSTAWATQLRLLAPTIVRRLNEELGHGTVALIEVLGPQAPSWKKGPRSARDGRGPRDTYG
jgi:predicted nucleic acid-binding Zn ribbon protein